MNLHQGIVVCMCREAIAGKRNLVSFPTNSFTTFNVTPPKTGTEPKSTEALVQMIFLSNWVMFFGSMLVIPAVHFQGYTICCGQSSF